jgi:hypothetical protein
MQIINNIINNNDNDDMSYVHINCIDCYLLTCMTWRDVFKFFVDEWKSSKLKIEFWCDCT